MASKDMLERIVGNAFFRGIGREELSALDDGLFRLVSLDPEEVIIREGEAGDEVFLLVEGTVRIKKRLSDGQEMEIDRLAPGEFFGEMAIIEGRERSATVSCATPCRLIGINRENFFTLVSAIPQLVDNIAGVIADRLRRSDNLRASATEKGLELLRLNQKINARKRELEIQKAQLEILNETKDKFFTIISHDLKSPLTTILGLSSMLAEAADSFSPENVKESAEIVRKSSQELHKLLENLLEWARAQTGALRYSPERVSLREIVSENTGLFSESARAKDIRLEVRIDGDEMVYADRNMVMTVVRNLASNAIKFTPQGGRVVFEAEERGDWMEVAVADTGVGLSPEERESLFRIDSHCVRKGTSGETGTGLGLILCKEFIDAHEGKLWVESEVGEGSTFRFLLPRRERSLPKPERSL